MRNSYFEFKQFRIEQGGAAMKVTTDACIFGALINIGDESCTVLDVGTGTGVLSLMLAQRNAKAKFVAIDVDESAYRQCKDNFENSIFRSQMQCLHQDFFTIDDSTKYDFIICNPPYFEGQLKSANAQKAVAWHSTQFNLSAFLEKSKSLLAENGSLWLLLPQQRWQEFEETCKIIQWTKASEVQICNNNFTKPHLAIFELCTRQSESIPNISCLIIRDDQLVCTSQFTNLMQPYYLHF
ncbi:MAG: hypothetical protein RL660_2095 [Bacteroidota bacterium]|jgi:tRNA1Val (adenine37-N6)-methyltransferase